MLKISNLKLGYGGKIVLDLPKLEVKESQHQLLTGNSGSGKTTLLYAIAGLLKPKSGSINILDTEITNLTPSDNDKFRGEHIGIVFQTLHMISAISVLDNIIISPFMAHKAQNKTRARHLLNILGVKEIAKRKPAEISHGQAQRVAIARAAINSPKLILADEPTSALDDASTEKVITLLFDIAEKSGSTLIIASHDARIKKYFRNTLHLGGANNE